MKRFKLLKDLPGIEAGTILERESPTTEYANDFIRKNSLAVEGFKVNKNKLSEIEKYSYRLLEKMVEDGSYKDWLKEISIYNLEDGDKFYFINYDSGYVDFDWLDENTRSKYANLLELGNIYLTNEEAESDFNIYLELARIRKWIYEKKKELGKTGYVIRLEGEDISILDTEGCGVAPNEIVFKNYDDAKDCLAECFDSWKFIFTS